jgi:hypothetical protein
VKAEDLLFSRKKTYELRTGVKWLGLFWNGEIFIEAGRLRGQQRHKIICPTKHASSGVMGKFFIICSVVKLFACRQFGEYFVPRWGNLVSVSQEFVWSTEQLSGVQSRFYISEFLLHVGTLMKIDISWTGAIREEYIQKFEKYFCEENYRMLVLIKHGISGFWKKGLCNKIDSLVDNREGNIVNKIKEIGFH